MDTSMAYFVDTSDSDFEDEVTPTYIHRKRLRLNSQPLDIENKRVLKLFRVSNTWNMSDNLTILEHKWRAGDKSSLILGDSEYPLQPWLMTPYRKAPEGSLESHYNTIHSKARTIIERVFGILKALLMLVAYTRELHYQPLKATQIINVCVLLHNLCMRYNVQIDEHSIVPEESLEFNSSSGGFRKFTTRSQTYKRSN